VYITAMNNRGATLGEIKHPLGFRKEPWYKCDMYLTTEAWMLMLQLC
jgi:hypothetical protein